MIISAIFEFIESPPSETVRAFQTVLGTVREGWGAPMFPPAGFACVAIGTLPFFTPNFMADSRCVWRLVYFIYNLGI